MLIKNNGRLVTLSARLICMLLVLSRLASSYGAAVSDKGLLPASDGLNARDAGKAGAAASPEKPYAVCEPIILEQNDPLSQPKESVYEIRVYLPDDWDIANQFAKIAVRPFGSSFGGDEHEYPDEPPSALWTSYPAGESEPQITLCGGFDGAPAYVSEDNPSTPVNELEQAEYLTMHKLWVRFDAYYCLFNNYFNLSDTDHPDLFFDNNNKEPYLNDNDGKGCYVKFNMTVTNLNNIVDGYTGLLTIPMLLKDDHDQAGGVVPETWKNFTTEIPINPETITLSFPSRIFMEVARDGSSRCVKSPASSETLSEFCITSDSSVAVNIKVCGILEQAGTLAKNSSSESFYPVLSPEGFQVRLTGLGETPLSLNFTDAASVGSSASYESLGIIAAKTGTVSPSLAFSLSCSGLLPQVQMKENWAGDAQLRAAFPASFPDGTEGFSDSFSSPVYKYRILWKAEKVAS